MSSVFIIAEAGVNHNGKLKLALELIEKAKFAGADAVKFQTFKARSLVNESAPLATYQASNVPTCKSQYELIKALELPLEWHEVLLERCKELDIEFMSTAFDCESADFLNDLGVKRFKIPSGEVSNVPLLRKIAAFGKPVILSTGMCDFAEVVRAVQILKETGLDSEQLTVLHCTTQYPAPLKDVNLRVLECFREELDCSYGYSDHTLGVEISLAAVAMGSVAIEKHFTLDRALEGPDHKASLEPDELKSMITGIRRISESLGSREKKVVESERSNQIVARKSIFTSKTIKKGEMFTVSNITTLRPGDGLSAWNWDELLGKAAKRGYQAGEKVDEAEICSTD